MSNEWSDAEDVGNQICRICLTISDLLVPIFEGEGIELELEDKIRKHLPIRIASSDGLPHQLCFQCVDVIVSWDSLLNVCFETDKKLKKLIGGTGLKELGSAVSNKGHDSDDEPLMPPKKRKLSEVKNEDESLNKTRKKKNLKRRSKVPEMLKNSEKKKIDAEDNSDFASDQNNSKGGLEVDIKTEMSDFDDGEINNFEESDSIGNSGENSPVKCEFCNKTYKDKKYLSRHVKKAHDEVKPFEPQRCNVCGNVYKTRGNLERHYMKEHLSNQVECPVCHVSINSKKMDSHLRTVHGVKTETENEERFKCKFCEKWFKNKYVRNSHVKEVHLSEPMKCKLCDFEGVRAVLRRHRRDVHAEKRFPCSLCQGAFKTLHTLKMHMTAHSDLRCYTCDICGMGFKRLNNVRDHMKCHEQKSNQCQICGNFFARKRYLAIHEKTIHNFYADGVIPEEKGFECGTCGAKLKWKKNLLAHMRIHTGEKPYVCKICKKDFICHGSLRTHMAKHNVCAVTDNIVQPIPDSMQEPQNHLPMEINVFNHFNPPQV